MSVCRFWWDGSQVYVYESDRGWVCCGCRISPTRGMEFGDDEAALVEHLREHVAAGEIVPPHAFAAFDAEHPDPGPAIAARDAWRAEHREKYGFIWERDEPSEGET